MSNADKPAFPSDFKGTEKDELGMPVIVERKCYGMTMREYFAAMAMQGIMANPACSPETMQQFMNIAEDAIRVADELLKQLEPKQ